MSDYRYAVYVVNLTTNDPPVLVQRHSLYSEAEHTRANLERTWEQLGKTGRTAVIKEES